MLRLIQKATRHHRRHQQDTNQQTVENKNSKSDDLDVRVTVHYGIPYTSSIMAFDPVQRLLAVGTLDGRIKIFGGDNIEMLLMSSKTMPYKALEFLSNKGFLIGVTNENDIQVWDLKGRCMTDSLQWEANVTAFSTIRGTYFMYIGDDTGSISVLKYDTDGESILQMSYHIGQKALTEAAGIFSQSQQSIVGILPQPFTSDSVLIAYESGIMILWDISMDQVITVKGYSDLHLKDAVAKSPDSHEVPDKSSEISPENDICSLCWASRSGSTVAVGYIDGDILLWNLSLKGKGDKPSSNDVIKLQLSSGGRRLPVIVLHWSPDSKSKSDCGGSLFVYGGDDMGSDEVITVLHLDGPSGDSSVSCIARVDLTLNGSFADMKLIPMSGITESSPIDAIFVLTNPGQLNVYDEGTLFIKSQKEGSSVKPESFPVTIPAIDPSITVTNFCHIPTKGDYLKSMLEKSCGKHVRTSNSKWPLTGGVHSRLYSEGDSGIEKLYVAGYQDGSVRLWDATYPVLRLMSVLEWEVGGPEFIGKASSVSALSFCSASFMLATGSESGLVRVCKICESPKESGFQILSEARNEAHSRQSEGAIALAAVINIVNSPVQVLQFVESGSKLVIGHKSGQVLLIDMNPVTVLFNVNCSSSSNSTIIAIEAVKVPWDSIVHHSEDLKQGIAEDAFKKMFLVLSKDAHLYVLDGVTGNLVNKKAMHPQKECLAVSLHILGGSVDIENDFETEAQTEPVSNTPTNSGNESYEEIAGAENQFPDGSISERFQKSLLLLCWENSIALYPLKSVIQGNDDVVQTADLFKPCCWSTILKQKKDEYRGVILLYKTGNIEIRSLPDLKVLDESSINSLLRWNFKTNMDKTFSSSHNGQISMVSGCEVAFVSTATLENDFRIPQSLPCLHDDVLAAAADAAINLSNMHKNRQENAASGGLGGFFKGFLGSNPEKSLAITENAAVAGGFVGQLEEHFSRIPFLDLPDENLDEVEEFNIDDIEIDDPIPVKETTSSQSNKHQKQNEAKERAKLFDGTKEPPKPRARTAEEIMTQYKFGGDAAAAAAHAREKLAERQEKLQQINERTEELRNRAEDFESMAKELAKRMEQKKWWKL